MKKKHYILLAISLFIAHTAQAQLLYLDNEFVNFDYNIKQIGQFILRFNLKELLIQPIQSSQYERDNRIILFDGEYYRDNSDYLNDFLNSVEQQHTILSFCDSSWYALAECNVTFRGKKDKLTLILRTEQVKDDIYKWCISDAKGAMLELAPRTLSDKLCILPTDNEVNFIALQSVTTTNAQNITLYDNKTHVNDRLSVFNCLVYNNLLKIDNVQQLTYCFSQVKGYNFYVKNFTRNSKNAGWLIYDVQEEITDAGNKSIDGSAHATTKQLVSQFYRMLSDYSENPRNIKLARTIQTMFYNAQKRNFFFETNHIYDDIDVYMHKQSPSSAYVAISDYLNSIDNSSKDGITLSYHISDFNIVRLKGDKVIVTYKLTVKNKETYICEYRAQATLQNNLFVDIIPLTQ